MHLTISEDAARSRLPRGEARSAETAEESCPALGTSRIELPPPPFSTQILGFNDHRRERYRRRVQSSEWLIRGARIEAGLPPVATPGTTANSENWVRPPRPARCRWRVGELVGVHHSGEADTPGHWSGVERCGSIHACPVCSAVIRSERAHEIQAGVKNWQAEKKHLVFVTLTMRHRTTDKLAVTLDAALKAWQRLLQGSSWGRFRKKYGVKGYIRAVEVTLGANGWHPHLHALLFTDQPMSEKESKVMAADLYQRWGKYILEFGGGLPSKLRGVDVRPADKNGRVVAQYLSKVQDGKNEKKEDEPNQRIGHEMARFDFKTGRGASMMPFELLDPSRRQNSADDFAAYQLWNEYFNATRGRRAITWSRGLRELVGAKNERTDQEIVEDTEKAPLIFSIPGKTYDRMKNSPDTLALILESVEVGTADFAEDLADSFTPPPSPPRLPVINLDPERYRREPREILVQRAKDHFARKALILPLPESCLKVLE